MSEVNFKGKPRVSLAKGNLGAHPAGKLGVSPREK